MLAKAPHSAEEHHRAHDPAALLVDHQLLDPTEMLMRAVVDIRALDPVRADQRQRVGAAGLRGGWGLPGRLGRRRPGRGHLRPPRLRAPAGADTRHGNEERAAPFWRGPSREL